MKLSDFTPVHVPTSGQLWLGGFLDFSMLSIMDSSY